MREGMLLTVQNRRGNREQVGLERVEPKALERQGEVLAGRARGSVER